MTSDPDGQRAGSSPGVATPSPTTTSGVRAGVRRRSRRPWLRGRVIRIGPLVTHTTNLISGALFAAIGVLFIVTEGAANIGGVTGVDTQYTLQAWLQGMADTVTDATVLFSIAVITLLVLLVRIAVLKQRRTPEAVGAPETSDSSRADTDIRDPRTEHSDR